MLPTFGGCLEPPPASSISHLRLRHYCFIIVADRTRFRGVIETLKVANVESGHVGRATDGVAGLNNIR